MLKKYFFLLLVLFSMNQLFSQTIKDTLLFNKNSDGNYQLVFIDTPQSSYHKKVIESLISNNVSVNDKSAIAWDIHVNNKKTKLYV